MVSRVEGSTFGLNHSRSAGVGGFATTKITIKIDTKI